MHTFSVAFTLFIAGMLTILLPCILPLVPIVLGVSVAGSSRLRPLCITLGMVMSFVVFNFFVFLLLNAIPEIADMVHLGTFYVLLLFGWGFLVHDRTYQLLGAVTGSVAMFFPDLWMTVGFALFGLVAMYLGGNVATMLQQFGTDIQTRTRTALGAEHPLTALLIGLTLGLVWVPCAGPALGFALALVREEPGFRAFILLFTYALGAGVPLLLVGYGGQFAVRSVRNLTKYSSLMKEIAGAILILTALALRFDWFTPLQTFIADRTSYGRFATTLEESFFSSSAVSSSTAPVTSSSRSSIRSLSSSSFVSSSVSMAPVLSDLPKLSRAPEFASKGPWHNSQPLTMAGLKGKVVLVDFWTYSCINCIRTLPYIQGYWEKYAKTGKFVVVGVHSPEFVFEQSEQNVKGAIKKYGLTYPVVQDNDFGTWNAFANRYWPAKYLIDADGYIRYEHFGEGNYGETDEAIASLLSELGNSVPEGNVEEPSKGGFGRISPETYLGSRSWPALANAQGDPSSERVIYSEPRTLSLNQFALVGTWQLMDGERQILRSDTGEIRMAFQGGEINLVMGLSNGVSPGSAEVLIDGKSVKSFVIDHDDLYALYKGPGGQHTLQLKVRGQGIEAYAFTFGQ